jgi:hypothetical protein
MKNLITAMICLASLSSFAQNTKSEFDGATWKAPYKLITPIGWNAERSLLANQISPQGVEDLRLAPGWNDSKSNEYLTYTSLWTLDGDHKTDEEIIEKSLTYYCAELLNKSMEKRKIPAGKISSVEAWVTELNNEKGDLKTYFGAIAIPDFKEPMSLHCLVHVRKCPGQNKTFIFYEFSPKPLDDIIWKSLDQLWLEFDCIPGQPHSSN